MIKFSYMGVCKLKVSALIAFGVFLVFSFPLSSQNRISSREMEQAIRLYQEGKDNDAMDRFMNILIKGSPAEKSLANEYINKITMRMNTGIDTGGNDSVDSSVREVPQEKDVKPKIETKSYLDEKTTKSSEVFEKVVTTPTLNGDVASKILEKINEMRREVLLTMSKISAFKVFLKDQNTPVAILIDEDEIFSSGATFKPKAIEYLQNLSALFFTTGKANIVLLPRGSATGEIEIASIRRAIAVSSYLTSRGISPSRLSVNLTGANVVIPKQVNNVNGLLFIFYYDKEMALKGEDDMKTGGPKVSMGIYPPVISAYKDEGAIIEFSVLEGSGGLPTWKFEIFRVNQDNSMLAIQTVEGYGSKYNQTFFNGREKFFGAYYPWGRYVFSITATDMNGKETSEKRFLLLKPSPQEEKKISVASSTGKTLSKPAVSSKKPTVAPKLKPSTSKGLKKASLAKSVKDKKKANEIDEKAPSYESSEQVVYKIYFDQGNYEITPNSKKKLETIASTMDNYPDSKIEITGYAYKKETNPLSVAKKRAAVVKKELVNKYGLDPKAIKQKTFVSKTLKTIVEVKLIQE